MRGTQDDYDDAMFAFSQGDYAGAAVRFKNILEKDPNCFDAQLALGMAHYRMGDFAAAVAEGLKAEKLRPQEQLVHTNLSLFYMKLGDKKTAEHHGLQAKLAGWKAAPGAPASGDPDLEMAAPKPQAFKLPEKFPDMPWKKKPKLGGGDATGAGNG
jgi:tetratricopeptide (TPR) repeat protein